MQVFGVLTVSITHAIDTRAASGASRACVMQCPCARSRYLWVYTLFSEAEGEVTYISEAEGERNMPLTSGERASHDVMQVRCSTSEQRVD